MNTYATQHLATEHINVSRRQAAAARRASAARGAQRQAGSHVARRRAGHWLVRSA
jgi:hypothetical protein